MSLAMQEQSETTVDRVAGAAEWFAADLSGDTLIGLCILAAVVVGVVLVHWLLHHLFLKGARKARAQMLVRILERIGPVARLVLVVLVIEMALPFLEMPDAVNGVVERLVRLVFIGTLGWLAVMVLHGLTDVTIRRHRIDVEDNLEARKVRTRMRVLRQMMSMLIALVTVAAMLMTFPQVRAIGVSLFASAGVAGIVVGFAARPVLSNLLAGIQIALTQPLRIGDAVIMEGEWGWIEEITSTYVVVKIWDWRRLVVPLTRVIEQPFQNWTRETASIIGNVVWHLDYTAPVDKMRTKLKEFLDESELWDKDVQVLQVIDTTEETMTLRALMSAKNSPTAWDLRCEIREKMISWLQSEHPGALPRRRGQLQIDQSEIEITRPEAVAEGEGNTMGEKIGHPEEQSEEHRTVPKENQTG